MKNCVNIDSKMSSKFGYAPVNPKNGKVRVSGGLSVLLGYGFPLAIVFGISLCVINPAQGKTWRTFSHVSVKTREAIRIVPLRTDSYSFSHVIIKSYVVGVSTALLHVNPLLVSPSFSHAVNNPYAPARFSILSESRCSRFKSSSAFQTQTQTEPMSLAAGECSWWGFRQNFKIGKYLSDGAFFSWHNGSGFTVCKWRVSDANLIPAAIINPAFCAVNSD